MELNVGLTLKELFITRAKDSVLNNGDFVSPFILESYKNQLVNLDDLTTKSLILLVIDTGCDVCDQDLAEFAEESLIYGEFYNFVPVITESVNTEKKINVTNHAFKNILFTNQEFLKNYKIAMYPTFILINSEKRFISYVQYARELKKFFGSLPNENNKELA